MKKIIIGIIAITIIGILSLIVYINLSCQKDFSQEYPVNTELKITCDSAMIARGKYLAYGPIAHTVMCHLAS